MADVTIVMRPGWQRDATQLPKVLAELDKLAQSRAEAANSMSAAFKTKEVTIKGVRKGGKSPNYIAKRAEARGQSSVALVVTGNYAAMKDNYEHNTLLKVR